MRRSFGLFLLPAIFGLPAAAGVFTVTNTNNSGGGSLRQAILDANGAAGTDTIEFNIPGSGTRVIQPTSSLATISGPVILDATTQPGYAGVPLVMLDGSSAGTSVNGLTLTGGNSTIKGLAIGDWDRNGIRFDTNGNNVVEACYVGIDPNGTTARPNGSLGIFVNGAPGNRIGGPTAAQRNVVSGNNNSGIRISGASGNTIEGNFVGTNAAGTAGVGNGLPGGGSNILIDESTDTVVGGPTAAHGNLISGATLGHGINLTGAAATGTLIKNNKIGTNLAGTAAIPNASGGIVVTNGATDTTIEDNLLSGNQGAGGGVKIEFGATGTIVRANLIGVDVTGTAALGNFRGILIQSASGNTVGGPTPADGNVIAGNPSNGVAIQNAGADANVVQNNFIGTNAAGTVAFGNGNNGVTIETANNQVLDNVISGSTFNGIQLLGVAANNNVILRNRIGTNAAGTAELPNQTNGINVNDAPDNTIGSPGNGNVISGNGGASGNGISLEGDLSTGNVFQGNWIGTRSDGVTPLPNETRGIFISDAASDNLIGGTGPGEGNVIAANGDDGIGILNGTGNAIRGNSMFGNTQQAIDLWDPGVTPNDPNDPDTGANNRQNFPILTTATTDGCALTVQGTLDSLASTTFSLDFFLTETCDTSGNGEGRTYLGSASTTTNASGDATFTTPLAATAAAGQFVTATATDPNGNTSELCTCRVVTAALGGASACVFSDGFESGDAGAWSDLVP